MSNGGDLGQGSGSVGGRGQIPEGGRTTVAELSDASTNVIGQEDVPGSLSRDRWKWSLGQFHITELQTRDYLLPREQASKAWASGEHGPNMHVSYLLGTYCVPGPEPGSGRDYKVNPTHSSFWELMINSGDSLAVVSRLWGWAEIQVGARGTFAKHLPTTVSHPAPCTSLCICTLAILPGPGEMPSPLGGSESQHSDSKPGVWMCQSRSPLGMGGDPGWGQHFQSLSGGTGSFLQL